MLNTPVYRRGFLMSLVGGAGALSLLAAVDKAGRGGKVRIADFDANGNKTGVEEVDKIVKTDAEWKKQLSTGAERMAFDVTRKEGTEPAGTGKYAFNHADGLYHCICCNTVLFDSRTKFESGTGWPSYYQPIAKENVVEQTDRSFGEVRTKVSCARCAAHLGHVFDDGPKPTGLRYCMDSASLTFVPRGKTSAS
ncbi:MAG TPA: peptide-methionine (R)-S-oxide reductase MsrB [Bryobacteraceae bacterium]|jgi:peptide-methionine (R)-S-oxide reductase|nr:peptide-methionine (R)-S-oxide reductase MsrB [Bryobacteraceae bacterium]